MGVGAGGGGAGGVGAGGAGPVRLTACGDAAVVVDLGSLQDVLRLLPALQASRPPGVVDVVPGAASILLTCDPQVLPLAALRAWALATRPLAAQGAGWPGERRGGRGGDVGEVVEVVEITVRYDGEDLEEVAHLLGTTAPEVVHRHTAATWTVAFTGFAPGFGYLVAEGSGLRVPRRASPRPRVPAGAVGLAGEFSGVYPRASPGGWQLIGTTAAVIWDADAGRPALLAPGTRVRFTQVDR